MRWIARLLIAVPLVAALSIGVLADRSPAAAMVGGAPAATAETGSRHVVMLVGSRGNSCSATAIARDLLLTAAHCVAPGADYKLVEWDAARRPLLKDVAQIVRHPNFSTKADAAHRATADVALVKLAAPLPASIAAARLGADTAAISRRQFHRDRPRPQHARRRAQRRHPARGVTRCDRQRPAGCNCASTILRPAMRDRAWAPAPATPARRRSQRKAAGSRSSAW